MQYDLKVVGEYVSYANINMFFEMEHETAKRIGMSEEKLRDALTTVLEDLNTTEEKLNLQLGPKGLAQRKHENFTNNFLLSYLQKQDTEAKTAFTESGKIRKCLG
jgi:phosphoenolpyruvate carboxylase